MVIEITFEHKSSKLHEQCDGIHTAVIETGNYKGIYVMKDTDPDFFRFVFSKSCYSRERYATGNYYYGP